MKTKLSSLLAGVSLLALAGVANAGQPLALSDHQMDGVTAGAAATANAGGLALGDFLTFTTTQTSTDAVTSIASIKQVGSSFGGAFSAAAAASALFQAAAVSHADSSATLP
jgi:hypothetical protein